MLLKNYKYLTAIIAFLFLIMTFGCKDDASSTKTKFRQDAIPSSVAPDVLNPTISKLDARIKENPNEANLYAERANAYYEQQGYDEAIADITKAISLDSLQVSYHHQLADVYLDYNKSRLALNAMKSAAVIFPKSIPTLLKLSEFQLILKDNESCFRTLAKILEQDPQNAEAFFMMGMNFKDTDDDARAINSFQTAVENDPDLIDGWIELGYLFDSKNNPIATKYYDNALRVDSMNIIALEAKGNHLAFKGKYDEAILMYQKITNIDSRYADAFYNIGLIYMEQNKVKEAHNHFNIAIETDPLLIMAYFYRGKASELQGDISSAKNDYQQVLKMSPNFERAKEALALLN